MTTNSLDEQIKGTVLRPLADKFQELTRKIDSNKYEMPKTLEEATEVTEDYIEQAWQRLEKIFFIELEQAKLEARKDELERITEEPRRTADTFDKSIYVVKTARIEERLAQFNKKGNE